MQIKDITPGPQGQRGIKTVRRDAAPTGIDDFQPDDVPPADTSDHPGGPAGPATTATPATEVPAEPATVDQIREWLSIFVEPYQVVEIRIPQPFRGRVQSRLFRGPEEAARYAARWSGKAKAVYFTLNPLSPDKTEGSACARDVLERRWLFVDFDPIRAEGFGTDSATDVERRRARVVAVQARAWLRSLGFPDPVLCDSGNGFHLLYQIWLPNDDASKALIEGVLKALAARFDTEDVKVDTGLFDANRIDKVYGTQACKGPGTTERPHRYSRVLKVPDAIEPVATALLEELAAESKALDLEAEIARTPAAHAAGDGAGGPPVPAGANGRPKANGSTWVGTTVADDYRARGPDWGEILTGWTIGETRDDGEIRWTRPGKDCADGISATTGHAGQDCFHVFSDQAKPFAPNESYSKFQAYALLKHGGDESKAAAELYRAGYGTRQPPPSPTAGRHDPGANGRAATPAPDPIDVAALRTRAGEFQKLSDLTDDVGWLDALARLEVTDPDEANRILTFAQDALGKKKWAAKPVKIAMAGPRKAARRLDAPRETPRAGLPEILVDRPI
ncbi:MAG: hypothetical protein JO075_02955, partial [Acidimicrobiia bacterium]|nr:hypothetical protein [Acidimicrobiia bacterium]